MTKPKAPKQSKAAEVLAGQLQLALEQAYSTERSQAIKRGLQAKKAANND